MTVSKLPSGKYRAKVWSTDKRAWVSVPNVLAGTDGLPPELRGRSYASKRDAQRAKREAQRLLETERQTTVTVGEWWQRWTTDPLWQRPSESTNLHYKERTKAFVERYKDLPLQHVGELVVAQWLEGGKRNGTVPCLRSMFSDAGKKKAGRLIQGNPFAELGIEKSTGNREKTPPSVEEAWSLIRIARELTPPSFAAYLEVACFTAARPGELDAMRWARVDFEQDEVDVAEQWNAKVHKFTLPKHHNRHLISLTPAARDCLLALEADEGRRSEFCFTTIRGSHYTPSARNHHWNRVRSAAGMGNVTLYLATRHFFGSYAVNILGLESPVVAEQLGHRDGGRLVEELYGHPDKRLRRKRLHAAFAAEPQRRGLRAIEGGSA